MKLFDNTIEFLEFLNKFRDVERRLYATGLDRMENDVEHSYQLAMLGWYLVNKESLDLDLNKIIKYALVHDLVETHAGDTPFMHDDHKTKKEREQKALEQIEKTFTNHFPELHETIKLYNERKDNESKFVNALDKLIPLLNGYMDEGRSWKELYPNMDLDTAIKIKRKDCAQHKTTEELLEEFLKRALKDKEFYFG